LLLQRKGVGAPAAAKSGKQGQDHNPPPDAQGQKCPIWVSSVTPYPNSAGATRDCRATVRPSLSV
jgi:hypothetical protein